MDKELDVEFYFGNEMGDVKKIDYEIFTHPVHEVINYKLGPFRWQSKVSWLPFRRDYDCFVMLGEPMTLSTWILLVLGKLRRKRMIFWTHGWYGREGFVKKFIKKIFFRLADVTMTYGEYAKELMIKEGFKEDAIKVIYNSLSYDEQLSIRCQLTENAIFRNHFNNDFQTVVFIGRLTPVKKLDQLLNACNIARNNGFDYNLVFIGDGQEFQNLQSETEALSLMDRVWFYGPSYDEKELSTLLYNADLCVAPGNIGLTAIHAMTFGCPCISHNDFKWQMPEFEAIKEGVTGSFFKKDDIESLSNAIHNWLSTKKEKRNEVREACYKEIDKKWNPNVQIEVIKDSL